MNRLIALILALSLGACAKHVPQTTPSSHAIAHPQAVATAGQVLISTPRVQWEYLDDLTIVEWFQLQIDAAPPINVGLPAAILPSPLTFEAPFSETGLADGDHSISVSACNTVGCSDPLLATATFTVTSTPPPPALVCPAAAVGAFTRCAYIGTAFDTLALVRTDAAIAFNWGASSPDPALPVDDFSVRWTGIFPFESGTYTFTDRSDDGIRIYLDDALILDRWIDRAVSADTVSVSIDTGSHTVRVEYYERGGDAEVAVNWALIPPVIPPPPPILIGDTIAPTVTLTYAQSGKSKNYTFIARASDNVGVVRVDLALDGRAPVPMTLQTNGTYTAPLVITAFGSHTATVRAFDVAGNVGSATKVFAR